jgi:hypothetical protein
VNLDLGDENGSIPWTDTLDPPPFFDCPWLIEVASGCLEPDSPSDLVKIVECGAKVTWLPDEDGWFCEAGHHHYSYGSDLQQDEERAEALAEALWMGEKRGGVSF